MALTDINFQEAEGQDFILEISLGSLQPAFDILTHGSFSAMVHEIEEEPPVEQNIFIMSE